MTTRIYVSDLWYHPESNTRMIENVPLDKRVGMVREVFRRLVRFGWFSATALKPLSDACLKPEAARIAKGELIFTHGLKLL